MSISMCICTGYVLVMGMETKFGGDWDRIKEELKRVYYCYAMILCQKGCERDLGERKDENQL